MIVHFDHMVSGHPHRSFYEYHKGGDWFRVCQMCGRTRDETLTPVDTFDGERAEMTGQTLCEECCLSLPYGHGWYGLSLWDIGYLWSVARGEHGASVVH